MCPLPLLLLLAGARVEGRQEATQMGKSHLEERQVLNQNKIKQDNCSQLLDTFSESSSNFTRCNDYLKFCLILYHWPGVQTNMHNQSSCVATALTTT